MCCAVLCLIAQSCPTLCDPINYSPPGSSVHWDSPGKNIGVGCHALLWGSFPPRNQTEVSCIAVTLLLSYLGSPTNHDGTANQNYLTSVRMAIIKKTTDKKSWPECREIGILVLF